MNEDLPPLGDDVESVLRRAGRPRPPTEFEARVMRRVAATITAGAAGVALGATASAGTSAATGAGSVGLGIKSGLIGVGLLAVGAGTGIALDRTVLAPPAPPPEIRIVTKEVRVEVPVEVRVEVPVERPAPAVAPRPAAPSSDRLLAEERAIVEMGRTALARGESALALKHCQDHAKRFPGGQLAEEREVLWIRALVAAGRTADAKTRAASFQKRFPHSLLTGSVLESIRGL